MMSGIDVTTSTILNAFASGQQLREAGVAVHKDALRCVHGMTNLGGACHGRARHNGLQLLEPGRVKVHQRDDGVAQRAGSQRRKCLLGRGDVEATVDVRLKAWCNNTVITTVLNRKHKRPHTTLIMCVWTPKCPSSTVLPSPASLCTNSMARRPTTGTTPCLVAVATFLPCGPFRTRKRTRLGKTKPTGRTPWA